MKRFDNFNALKITLPLPIATLSTVSSNLLLLTITLVYCSTSCKTSKEKHLPTAQEVVERYIEVSGGRRYIEAIRSLRIEGTMAVPNLIYAETLFLYQPGKICLMVTFPSKNVYKVIYNNGKVAEIAKGKSTFIEDSLKLERMKLNNKLLNDIGYFNDKYQLSFVNTEKLNGRLHYRIKVTSPLGAIDYKLYDVESGLLTFSADADGNKTTYSNYQTIEGFTLPMMEQLIDKKGIVTNFQKGKISFNKPIDPKLFEFK